MKDRLFTESKQDTKKIDFNAFMNAVKSGNTKTIDLFLEKKLAGYELDLDTLYDKEHDKTALEILLDNKDFMNAAKLINAGANINVNYIEWDYSGPLESYSDIGHGVDKSRNVFRNMTSKQFTKLVDCINATKEKYRFGTETSAPSDHRNYKAK